MTGPIDGRCTVDPDQSAPASDGTDPGHDQGGTPDGVSRLSGGRAVSKPAWWMASGPINGLAVSAPSANVTRPLPRRHQAQRTGHRTVHLRAVGRPLVRPLRARPQGFVGRHRRSGATHVQTRLRVTQARIDHPRRSRGLG